MTVFSLTDRARARAYVNHGRVVADCPRGGCASAEALTPGQGTFYCTACQHVASVEWPDGLAEIVAALEARPALATRNWFPAGHELALRAGCPHGQSAAELDAETREYGGQ
jgi:hypothetical protein